MTVDSEIAPLISALEAAGFRTLTSCIGSGKDGYVMFMEPDAQRFRWFWRQNAGTIGAPVSNRFMSEVRDAEWLDWMRENYPPYFPIGLDESGAVRTACWLFDSDEVLEAMPRLIRVLRSSHAPHAGPTQ